MPTVKMSALTLLLLLLPLPSMPAGFSWLKSKPLREGISDGTSQCPAGVFGTRVLVKFFDDLATVVGSFDMLCSTLGSLTNEGMVNFQNDARATKTAKYQICPDGMIFVGFRTMYTQTYPENRNTINDIGMLCSGMFSRTKNEHLFSEQLFIDPQPVGANYLSRNWQEENICPPGQAICGVLPIIETTTLAYVKNLVGLDMLCCALFEKCEVKSEFFEAQNDGSSPIPFPELSTDVDYSKFKFSIEDEEGVRDSIIEEVTKGLSNSTDKNEVSDAIKKAFKGKASVEIPPNSKMEVRQNVYTCGPVKVKTLKTTKMEKIEIKKPNVGDGKGTSGNEGDNNNEMASYQSSISVNMCLLISLIIRLF